MSNAYCTINIFIKNTNVWFGQHRAEQQVLYNFLTNDTLIVFI